MILIYGQDGYIVGTNITDYYDSNKLIFDTMPNTVLCELDLILIKKDLSNDDIIELSNDINVAITPFSTNVIQIPLNGKLVISADKNLYRVVGEKYTKHKK
jgi:hypothetical protein